MELKHHIFIGLATFGLGLLYFGYTNYLSPRRQDFIVELINQPGNMDQFIGTEFYKTPIVSRRGWTGAWPLTSELPVNQRRDTACPLTRVNETRKRVKRWPDIIGIGAPKCGTGTIAFFDCHSSIVFREAEGMVWHKDRKNKPNPTNLLKQYAIPKADENEILIEKTPEIMNGNYKQLKQRAIIMKSIMPHVKFLVMLCDPVKRFISHVKHRTHVGNVTRRDLQTIKNAKEDISRHLNSQPDGYNKSMLVYPTAQDFAKGDLNKTAPYVHYLRYGNYHTQLTPFIEVVGRENVIILDGAHMGNQETKYLEEELKLKHELEFEFNSNKGFNCLVEPTDYCLSDAKGRPSTVNKMAALAKEVSILSQYYKPEMDAVYDIIYPKYNRTEFCSVQKPRFEWLKTYVCP